MKQWKGSLILLLTAVIWGSSFVAQSAGMAYVEPFTYNALRTLIGGIVLLPVIFMLNRKQSSQGQLSGTEKKEHRHQTIVGGMICGVILCVASSLQQFGICTTSAGKTGFITSLYIIFVPVIGIFMGKKVPKLLWICVAIAIGGFYLLCMNEGLGMGKGDLLILFCAIFYAFHIIAIDHFIAKEADPVKMSCIQFWVAGLIMLVCMFLFESPNREHIVEARWTILYAGVLSSGVAYTLQMVGQRYSDPTIATLIMSLESVFSALSGWLVLGEVMTIREFLGCLLVFFAVVLAQIPVSTIKALLKIHKKRT